MHRIAIIAWKVCALENVKLWNFITLKQCAGSVMISVSGASGDFFPSDTVKISLFDLNIFLTLPIFPISLPISPQYLYTIKRPKYLWILEAKAPLISVLSGYFHKTPRGEGSLSPLTRPLLCRDAPYCSIIYFYIYKLCQTLPIFWKFREIKTNYPEENWR